MRTLSLLLLGLLCPLAHAGVDLTTLAKGKADFPNAKIDKDKADLSSHGWAYLRTKQSHDNAEVKLTFTIKQPARSASFFGQGWSAWPDRTFADTGFELGVLLREGDRSGYRVMLSHRHQAVALVRYPESGYVRVVSCELKTDKAHKLSVRVQANVVVVSVDGTEKIRYVDPQPLLPGGTVGVGTSGSGRVEVRDLSVEALAEAKELPIDKHVPRFSARKWLGGYSWVFDGDEPILQLPAPDQVTVHNVKLRPGLKPLLNWDSRWDISNQGAFPDGKNEIGPVKTAGGGKSLTASWTSKQTKGRFVTRTSMTVTYDEKRQTYVYDVESELEVLAGEPFHFRYGYDFEHHTPLDPFRWQYLVMRRKGGGLAHRPVAPFDPGPQNDLETNRGLRMWYGRHGEEMTVAPAVEYQIKDSGKRKLNTAVCAAFYDTGVSFEPETAKPGTKVSVRYRYVGYTREEARELFNESSIYPSPKLDPDHHFIFADEWPKLNFRQHVKLSETWIYGRRPFMSGHNARPTYELARMTETESGFAMKLGPGAFGAATLNTPTDLAAGTYAVIAKVRSDNAVGPGGRIEVTVTPPKSTLPGTKHVHYLGNKTWDWKTVGFAFEVPTAGSTLTLGLGNAGTGEVYVSEVTFRKVTGALPVGVAKKNNDEPPARTAAPEGAIADYRMEEGKGLHVYDYARGPLGILELANVSWKRDGGRTALLFADNKDGKKNYPRYGNLHQGYLMHPSYEGRDGLPVALAGRHGGGMQVKAFTLAAWVKPAEQMGESRHAGAGDVIGFGARRVVLRLVGQKAPYKLGCRLNVNDSIDSKTDVVADKWQHLAVTGEPDGKKWRVRLYLDGKKVGEGTTEKFDAPAILPPSLILGAEIFYFHDAYYRGLIGRTIVYDRALAEADVAKLAGER
jgi:hypothetical protein